MSETRQEFTRMWADDVKETLTSMQHEGLAVDVHSKSVLERFFPEHGTKNDTKVPHFFLSEPKFNKRSVSAIGYLVYRNCNVARKEHMN